MISILAVRGRFPVETSCPSPLWPQSLSMPHRVTWCASSAAKDPPCLGSQTSTNRPDETSTGATGSSTPFPRSPPPRRSWRLARARGA
jgi:hypothetical protein